MRSPITRLAVAALTGVVLVGCTSQEPEPDDVAAATDPTVAGPTDATGSPSGSASDEGLESSVTTSNSNVTSEVEVRVAEIISDYDGVTTEVGTTLTVPSEVLFDFDESDLRADAQARLDQIVEVVEFYDDAPVEVVGHTDSRGEDDYNQALSEARADSVAQYLTGAGVDGARLTVEGRGESDPTESNDTDAGRQANRRVEITIVGVEPPDLD